MPYEKTEWINDETPLNRTNMQKHEEAIEYAVDTSEQALSGVSNQASGNFIYLYNNAWGGF